MCIRPDITATGWSGRKTINLTYSLSLSSLSLSLLSLSLLLSSLPSPSLVSLSLSPLSLSPLSLLISYLNSTSHWTSHWHFCRKRMCFSGLMTTCIFLHSMPFSSINSQRPAPVRGNYIPRVNADWMTCFQLEKPLYDSRRLTVDHVSPEALNFPSDFLVWAREREKRERKKERKKKGLFIFGGGVGAGGSALLIMRPSSRQLHARQKCIYLFFCSLTVYFDFRPQNPNTTNIRRLSVLSGFWTRLCHNVNSFYKKRRRKYLKS